MIVFTNRQGLTEAVADALRVRQLDFEYSMSHEVRKKEVVIRTKSKHLVQAPDVEEKVINGRTP